MKKKQFEPTKTIRVRVGTWKKLKALSVRKEKTIKDMIEEMLAVYK